MQALLTNSTRVFAVLPLQCHTVGVAALLRLLFLPGADTDPSASVRLLSDGDVLELASRLLSPPMVALSGAGSSPHLRPHVRVRA
jgi:hypothetical protein